MASAIAWLTIVAPWLWLPAAHAERACLPEGAAWPEGWTTAYPAHRVIGNLYAVGMTDLAVFLITTSDGHILINTGLEDSLPAIRANVEQLGFRLDDVKVLLTTQAHFDHTAALAALKQTTGAQMWATAKDARVLADGGASDAHFGECTEFRFAPVAVDRVLADGEVIEFGGMRVTTHLHPGHTEGSSSYSFVHEEGGRLYNVVIANMGTINPGKQLVVDPTYPGAGDDFATTFRRQKAMPVDVWVAAHGSQYRLADKHTPGQPYSAQTFVDPEGFLAEVTRLEQLYLEQVASEQQ
jgi:metallo-beta-lactamase class B